MRRYLLVDSREKKPFWQPDKTIWLPWRSGTACIITVERRLTTGDYAFENSQHICTVERKGSLREIAQNCLTRDRERFISAIDRLSQSCKYPILFVEGSPNDLLRNSKWVKNGQKAFDTLLCLLAERGIQLVYSPSRTRTDREKSREYLLRLLLSYETVSVR